MATLKHCASSFGRNFTILSPLRDSTVFRLMRDGHFKGTQLFFLFEGTSLYFLVSKGLYCTSSDERWSCKWQKELESGEIEKSFVFHLRRPSPAAAASPHRPSPAAASSPHRPLTALTGRRRRPSPALNGRRRATNPRERRFIPRYFKS